MTFYCDKCDWENEWKSCPFHRDSTSLSELSKLVDNGTTHVTIATPKNWKCPKPCCRIDYLHKHSTYSELKRPAQDAD